MLLQDILSLQDNDREWLVRDCFRRAALNYEKAEVAREAAECWSEAGETGKAAELFLRLDDYERSAVLFLSMGRYTEALAQYRKWLAALWPEHEIARVTALLGVALCLTRMRQRTAEARDVYREARSLIEAASESRDALTSGRCWEALAQYGSAIARQDIIQVGYENALAHYGRQYGGERLRAARDFLTAVASNRLLTEELRQRVAEWNAEPPAAVPRMEAETGRYDAFVARGRAGNVSDVDYLMFRLENGANMATTKLVDYALSLVRTQHGEERIQHYLFNGTQTQRNYAALYFKRLGQSRRQVLVEAVNQGKIDRAQAFSK